MSESQLTPEQEIQVLALDRACALHRDAMRLLKPEEIDVGAIVLENAARFAAFIREADQPDARPA